MKVIRGINGKLFVAEESECVEVTEDELVEKLKVATAKAK